MEIMNLLILTFSLQIIELIILDNSNNKELYKIQMNTDIQKLKEIDCIPSKPERFSEYSRIISEKILKISMLDQSIDYTFNFKFYTNGNEQLGNTSPVTKLCEMYCFSLIFIDCHKKQNQPSMTRIALHKE